MPVTQGQLYEQSIRYVKGVGPRRSAQLAALGIETLEDILWDIDQALTEAAKA